jgi:hypothetical protein
MSVAYVTDRELFMSADVLIYLKAIVTAMETS